jgi:hypothetical protein
MAHLIEKLSDWTTFESLIKEWFKLKFENPDVKKFESQGNPQFGIDIYGKDLVTNTFIVAQCKNYSGKNKNTKEIQDDIIAQIKLFDDNKEKIENIYNKTKKYYYVTSSKKPAGIDEFVEKLSDTREAEGKSLVIAYFWEDIVDEVQHFKKLIVRYFATNFIDTEKPNLEIVDNTIFTLKCLEIKIDNNKDEIFYIAEDKYFKPKRFLENRKLDPSHPLSSVLDALNKATTLSSLYPHLSVYSRNYHGMSIPMSEDDHHRYLEEDSFCDFINGFIKDNWLKFEIKIKNTGKSPGTNLKVKINFITEVYIYEYTNDSDLYFNGRKEFMTIGANCVELDYTGNLQHHDSHPFKEFYICPKDIDTSELVYTVDLICDETDLKTFNFSQTLDFEKQQLYLNENQNLLFQKYFHKLIK